MDTPKPPSEDSRETLVKLFGEYGLRFMVAGTGCVLVLIAVCCYFAQYLVKDAQKIDIRDVVIVGGIGYSAAVRFLFGDAKGKARGA